MRWLRRHGPERDLVRYVPVKKIRCRGMQPRRTTDPRAFRVLLRSVRAHGMLVPLIARPRGAIFELIAGHRRLLAAHKLGLREVPVIVRHVENHEMEELRLLESATQELWPSIDFATALEKVCLESSPGRRKRLLEMLEISEEELPDLLRPLTFPELVKDAISLGLATEEEGERLAREADEEAILRTLRRTKRAGPGTAPRKSLPEAAECEGAEAAVAEGPEAAEAEAAEEDRLPRPAEEAFLPRTEEKDAAREAAREIPRPKEELELFALMENMEAG
jgi:ParB/RepB/Spo0J family partition protein